MFKEITPSRLAATGVKVEVKANDAAIHSAAEAMAATLTLRHANMSDLIEKEQLEEGFEYALNVVLTVDSGAKPIHDPIPKFMSDLVVSLNGEYRGIRITVEPLKKVERPAFYDSFVTILESTGVSMGRPNKVDPYTTSGVMLCGVEDVNGVETLVGVEKDFKLEDLLLRAMITASEEEQEKLRRIVGHMDLMYVSADELLRQWSTTAVVETVNA